MKLLQALWPSTSPEYKARQRYAELVDVARAPMLFEELGIPDTLDGRFESVILHLLIEEKTLERQGGDHSEWLRLLHESFFEDMDRSLREGGVGDTGISKRVQRMASGFYGRLASYKDSWDNESEFTQALTRNVYATCETDIAADIPPKLAAYIRSAVDG